MCHGPLSLRSEAGMAASAYVASVTTARASVSCRGSAASSATGTALLMPSPHNMKRSPAEGQLFDWAAL